MKLKRLLFLHNTLKILGLLCFSSLLYASSLFNVTLSNQALTINTTIPNFTYYNVSISFSGDQYRVVNPALNCNSVQNGDCLFTVSDTVSKVIPFNGPANQNLAATLCLNGIGKLSCQVFSFDVGDFWTNTNGPQYGEGGATTFNISSINSQRVYAGSDSQGLFRTLDGGKTWTSLDNPNLPENDKLIFSHAVVAGATPNLDTIFLSTFFSGLFKSTDGGATFIELVNYHVSNARSLAALDPLHVYAGSTSTGVYETIDGGVTWNQTGLTTGRIQGLQVVTPNIIYAGDATFGGGATGVYKSVDGGTTFVTKNNGITDLQILTLFAVNSDIVFAGTDSGGVFKTIDGGENWVAVNNGLESLQIISITAIDENTIYVISLNPNKVYKTVDGGANWQLHDDRLPEGKRFVHASSDGVVYVGTLASPIGVYKGS